MGSNRTLIAGQDRGGQSERQPDPTCKLCHGTGKIAGVAEHQLGLEKTPQEYVEKIVAGFREVRRVLRPDGTAWVNLGDCYTSGGRDTHGTRIGYKQETNEGYLSVTQLRPECPPELKPKDLVGMPWRVAFALQADGWYLRRDIIEEVQLYCPCGCGFQLEERIWRWSQDRDLIWSKPNPMPESVTDRPTTAHEYIFLLSKSERYFYDAEAIKEPAAETERRRADSFGGASWRERGQHSEGGMFAGSLKRNKRSVWELATSPFPEAHFATFPPKLVEPCILAGTSEKGCCPACGAPWKRQIEPSEAYAQHLGQRMNGYDYEADKANGMRALKKCNSEYRTVGWKPTCKCPPAEPVPGTVLDPFCGAGTTGLVAERLGRDFIGIELSPLYAGMAQRRLHSDRPLFADVQVVHDKPKAAAAD